MLTARSRVTRRLITTALWIKIRGNAVKEGHTFSGWKIGNGDAKDFEIKSNVIIQGFFTQNTHHYTINKHFYNENDVDGLR